MLTSRCVQVLCARGMQAKGKGGAGDELYRKQIAELAGGPVKGPAGGMVPRVTQSPQGLLAGLVPAALLRWLRRVSPAFKVRPPFLRGLPSKPRALIFHSLGCAFGGFYAPLSCVLVGRSRPFGPSIRYLIPVVRVMYGNHHRRPPVVHPIAYLGWRSPRLLRA